MKKQLIVMAITLIMTTSINAMQGQKSIAYNDQYKFDVYKYLTAKDLNDLKPGKTFTLTNVDKFAKPGSPQELRDANGNVWAKKTGAFFTGTSNRGSETWNIISTPAITAGRTPAVAPRETEAAVVKTAVQPPSESLGKAKTKEEIVLAYKAAIDAFKNNDVKALIRNFDRLPENMPQGGEEYLAKSGITDDTIMNAIKAAHPETQVAFFKYVTKKENPKAYDEEIARLTLKRAMYGKDKEMLLPAIKWLLEKEKVKDINGEALGEAIDSGFYEAAKLLKENGSPVTAYAKSSAERMFRNKKDDRFLKLLGINLPAAQTQAAPASAPVTAAATPAAVVSAAAAPAKVISLDEEAQKIIDAIKTATKAALKNDAKSTLENYKQFALLGSLNQLVQTALKRNPEYITAIENFRKAMASAHPSLKVVLVKYNNKLENPGLSDEENSRMLLQDLVSARDQKENLPLIKELIENQKVKDLTGDILNAALDNDFPEAVELLIKSGAKITDFARDYAINPKYQKLFAGTSAATTAPTTATGVLTNKEIIAIFQDVAKAIQNNDIQGILANYAQLPTGKITPDFQKLMESTGLGDKLEKAYKGANLETKTAFWKAEHQRENPILQGARLSTQLLLDAVNETDAKLLEFMLMQKNIKDATGAALEQAIKNNFYEGAELLIKNGSPKTQAAIDAANAAALKDDRYQKLLGIAPSQPLVGKMADAQKDDEFKKAIESGNFEEIKRLIAAGTSAEKFKATASITPLGVLLTAKIPTNQKIEITDYLLFKGADKDKSVRNAALANAAANLDRDSVRVLLLRGANDASGAARQAAKLIADDFMQSAENRDKAKSIIELIEHYIK